MVLYLYLYLYSGIWLLLIVLSYLLLWDYTIAYVCLYPYTVIGYNYQQYGICSSAILMLSSARVTGMICTSAILKLYT